jgi:ribosome modulation factor
MSPFDQGYQAFIDGDSAEDNPFVYGTFDWNQWHDGFTKAEEDEA